MVLAEGKTNFEVVKAVVSALDLPEGNPYAPPYATERSVSRRPRSA